MAVEGNSFRWFGKTLPKTLADVRLVILSDLHYGNPYCSQKHFLRTVDWIAKTENAYCLLNGDLCEAATRNSVGDVYDQIVTPKAQKRQVAQ